MLSISGRVVAGAERGSKIGFRTANIRTKARTRGVYAVRVKIGDKIYRGVANIGYAPTFGRKQKMLEVHIFRFRKNIIGKKIGVELVKKLRDEKKFSSVDELKKQIQKDVRKTKILLNAL